MILKTAYITLFICFAIVFNLVFLNIIIASPRASSESSKKLISKVYKEAKKRRRFVSAGTEQNSSSEQIIAEDTEESGDDFIKKLKLFLGAALFVFSFGKLLSPLKEGVTNFFLQCIPPLSGKKYLAISVLRI